MFDILDDVFDSVASTINRTIHDPVGTASQVVTQPLHDVLDVVEGLTEGELRVWAVARLGTDAASGMALSELIEVYQNS